MDDRDFALFGVPWMIADHYLTARQWHLSFDPFEAIIEKVAVWVRLPDLEMEYYDISVLWKIGNHIDRNLKIDRATSIGTRGNYARICVEVDLTRPLLSKSKFRAGRLDRGLGNQQFRLKFPELQIKVLPRIKVLSSPFVNSVSA